MNSLIKMALNTRIMKEIDTHTDEYGTTIIYGIESDTHALKVWNSSNLRGFRHKEALNNIVEYLLNGDTDGSVSQDFKEIMFEIIEK